MTKKKLFFSLVGFLPVFLLSACVSVYQEPAANVPKATISFNDEPHLGLVNDPRIYGNPVTCQDLYFIKPKKMFAARKINVPADQLITIRYIHQEYLGANVISPKLYLYDYNTCGYIVSFIPKKDKSYSMEVTDGAEINNK